MLIMLMGLENYSSMLRCWRWRRSELFSCCPFRVIQENFAPSRIFLLLIFFPPSNFLGTTTSSPESKADQRRVKSKLKLLSSEGSVDEKGQVGFNKGELSSSKSFAKSSSSAPQKMFNIHSLVTHCAV